MFFKCTVALTTRNIFSTGGRREWWKYFSDENCTEHDNSIPSCSKHWQWGLWFIHEPCACCQEALNRSKWLKGLGVGGRQKKLLRKANYSFKTNQTKVWTRHVWHPLHNSTGKTILSQHEPIKASPSSKLTLGNTLESAYLCSSRNRNVFLWGEGFLLGHFIILLGLFTEQSYLSLFLVVLFWLLGQQNHISWQKTS